MAQFLTTSGITSAVEGVVRDAQTTLTLISPFLKLSPDLVHRLKDAVNRGVAVHIVYGKESLNTTEWQKIAELDRVRVSFLQRLHAKCYMNEAHAVITSMNLHEFSEKNNREMGVLLEREADAAAFRQVAAEVESIIQEATPEAVRGVCIRCRSSILYGPLHPLCDTCFSVWVQWGNDDFEEKYCHRCGQQSRSSRARPLCYECFRVEPFERVFG